jgi:hypothetical protein
VLLRLINPGPEQTTCSIFDVSGRRVTVLPMNVSEDGLWVRWDATDELGRLLPSGVYYARVGGVHDLRRKIILIR